MEENQHTTGKEIAVIGMASRFPGAENIKEFWENLKNGVESIATLSDEELEASGVAKTTFEGENYVRSCSTPQEIDKFDAGFFSINPREAEVLDPQQRVFLECAWETMEHAGYSPANYDGLVGVFAGSGINSYLIKNVLPSTDLGNSVGAFEAVMSNDKDFLPTRVSYKLNLKGPSINIQTACSTSLVAIHLACRSLLQGECDMAMAGGVSLRVPQKAGYTYQEGMILSRDGHCRAFDKDASGIVDGSGAGAVLLKPLSDALEDGDKIYAVIKGSSVNNDGAAKVGYTAPSIEGQAAVVRDALGYSGVNPATIGYVEAHGTGTSLGDPIEIRALRQAYEEDAPDQINCAIGSVKTNIGHLDAAAGVAGFIKSVLALVHRQIPASLNYQESNPAIDFGTGFYVNDQLKDWEKGSHPRRAAISSFGIGGTNAHLILEEAPEVAPSTPTSKGSLLVLSAKTPTALEKICQNLVDFLKEAQPTDLGDTAYTLQTGREPFRFKRAVYVQNTRDAIQTLASLDPKRVKDGVSDMGKKEVVFLFSGQGSQYLNMGKGLYDSEPVFRQTIDYCSQVLSPHLGFRLTDALFPSGGDPQAATERLKNTAVAQPALFSISYSLAKLWISRGVIPSAMVGHSVGEYTAACLSGVFSLEQALELIALRGKLMQSCLPGKMLATGMTEDQVQEFIGNGIELAAINGPTACVLSGPSEAIDALAISLNEQGKQGIVLQTSHAFHSAMMEPILGQFEAALAGMELNAPRVPFLSNQSGAWITGQEAVSPKYWASHLRNTVRFNDNVEHLLQNDNYVLLEVGPGNTLASLCLRHPLRQPEQQILNSLPHPKDSKSADQSFEEATGGLWLAGIDIDWEAIYDWETRYKVALPTYPFERQSYWIQPRKVAQNQSSHPVKNQEIADWFYLPSWKRSGIVAPAQPDNLEGQRWLIFAGEDGISNSLVGQIKSAGAAVILVREGDEFVQVGDTEYAIRPGIEKDYGQLLDQLSQNGETIRILHAWNVEKRENRLPGEVEAQLDRGLYSLLHVAKAIGNRSDLQDVRLTILSSQVQDVTGAESLNPAKATLLGACKVISLEYPVISCRHIDLNSEAVHAGVTTQLLGEIQSDSTELMVAYRGGHRWLPGQEKVRMPAAVKENIPLKENGVYLITGGFGGMGYTTASSLARKFKARLVLLGRSEIPARSEWSDWIAEKGKDDSTSQRIAKVQELEKAGAQVLAFAADVADADAMGKVITDSLRTFGRIDGVFHFAGLADYAGMIQVRTKEDTQNILAPKVQGTLLLEALLSENPPDFMLLASTIGSVLYHSKFGQVGYCAANDFLDAYAIARSRSGNTSTQVINWNDWDEVGMTMEAARRWAQRGQGSSDWQSVKMNGASVFDDAVTPEEGIEVILRALGSKIPRLIVCTQDIGIALEQDRKNNFTGIFDQGEDHSGATHSRPELSNLYVEPSSPTEIALAAIWQRLLGLDQIGINDNFFELGGHSLIGIQILSDIRGQFGIEINIAQLFEFPTVGELSIHIEKSLTTQNQGFESVPANTVFEEEGEI